MYRPSTCHRRRFSRRCRCRLDARAARSSRIARRDCASRCCKTLRRRGAVIGLSGGIDSSVTAALCVEALGREERARACSCRRRIPTPTACASAAWWRTRSASSTWSRTSRRCSTAAGCYSRRDDFIRKLVPEFGAGLGLQGRDRQRARARRATTSPRWWCSRRTARREKLRMPLDVYLGIVAATNMKQRTRKQIEYYHADRLNYAVIRHAEPARIRPGLLRQERRRRGRRQADRASLQEPGLSACRASRRAGGNPPPAADHRHLVAGADRRRSSTSRCPITRWTSACTASTTALPAEAVAQAAGLTVEQVERSGATSPQSARPRAICTSRRCWSTRTQRRRCSILRERPEPAGGRDAREIEKRIRAAGAVHAGPPWHWPSLLTLLVRC